jgi:hypothetical protein
MQAPQQQQSNSVEAMYVNSLQQVEQVQIQPGQTKMIIAQNESIIAMRSADNMGLATTDYYKLVPVYPFSQQEQTQKAKPNYVTEEQLEKRLGELVESIKSNSSVTAKQLIKEVNNV